MDIRRTEYDEADYEAVVRITKAIRPDDFVSVEDLADWDVTQRSAGRYSTRWFARVDGEVVAYASLQESPWRGSENPTAHVAVHPDWEGNGIGRSLLEQVEVVARARGAATLRLSTEDDQPRAMRFIDAAGYREIDREWRSTLDLAAFDPRDWQKTLDRVEAGGVTIVSLAELREGDPRWADRLYELYSAVEADIPEQQPFHPTSRSDWERLVLGRDLLADGFLLAVEDGDLVGLTEPTRVEGEDDAIDQELTGVAREARGRGIATALKIASAVWAKEQGYRSIRTYNARRNAPMLAVNDKLGFDNDHAIFEYRKEL